MHIADTLSRAHLPESAEGSSDIEVLQTDLEQEVKRINMVEFLPISTSHLQEIQRATEHDDSLQTLKAIIMQGWPDAKSDVPSCVHPYFHVRDELAVQNGIIFRGEWCIIPRALRSSILNQIHSSHLGTWGCLRHSRECLYWPNMNAEFKDYIQKCDICRTYDSSNPSETLQSHDVPGHPWQKIGTDLFTISNQNYLITVDYFSNFWEVDHLRQDMTAKTVIKQLKAHFARYGCHGAGSFR